MVLALGKSPLPLFKSGRTSPTGLRAQRTARGTGPGTTAVNLPLDYAPCVEKLTELWSKEHKAAWN